MKRPQLFPASVTYRPDMQRCAKALLLTLEAAWLREARERAEAPAGDQSTGLPQRKQTSSGGSRG